MILADTHTHLNLKEFDADLDDVIQNAIQKGIKYFILPNIDSSTASRINEITDKYPQHCFALWGLHPTSVNENYKDEIQKMNSLFENHKYIGIGETGIDLYWDKTFLTQQQESFRVHINKSISENLPLIIHSRQSHEAIMEVLSEFKTEKLKGIFHCFSGNVEQAEQVIELGFKIGVGGVVTYKNSLLKEVVENISLENIVLETDAPYLSPVPYRGKRNESAYIYEIAEFVAKIKNISISKVAEITTSNTMKLFFQ